MKYSPKTKLSWFLKNLIPNLVNFLISCPPIKGYKDWERNQETLLRLPERAQQRVKVYITDM